MTDNKIQKSSASKPLRKQGSMEACHHNNSKQPKNEKGGQKGPEPTRYGDWEKGGRVTDF